MRLKKIGHNAKTTMKKKISDFLTVQIRTVFFQVFVLAIIILLLTVIKVCDHQAGK